MLGQGATVFFLSYSQVVDNEGFTGGGVYLGAGGFATLTHVLFARNKGTATGGGGIFVAQARAVLESCTFLNNGGGGKGWRCRWIGPRL